MSSVLIKSNFLYVFNKLEIVSFDIWDKPELWKWEEKHFVIQK